MTDDKSDKAFGVIMLRLDFLRHGETQLLSQGFVIRGRTDDALTAVGWQQMQVAFERQISQAHWQAIISSPLSRCRDFAQKMAEKYQLPLHIIDDLAEMDFGAWEGRFTEELYEKYPEELARWWQTPTVFTPPNAESLAVFAHRIDEALEKIAQMAYAQHYQNLCIISHGGVMKYLYCKVNHLPLDDILKQPVALGEFHHFGLDKASVKVL